MIALLAVMLSAMDDCAPRRARRAVERISVLELGFLLRTSGCQATRSQDEEAERMLPWEVALPLLAGEQA